MFCLPKTAWPPTSEKPIMKVSKVIIQTVAIFAFLGAVGLMFNYLLDSTLSNPFIANKADVEQQV